MYGYYLFKIVDYINSTEHSLITTNPSRLEIHRLTLIKLLFHPYDDRGADLLGPDAEALRPFYESLHDFLLNWDREEMARKFRPTRPVFLRILTTTTDPERIRVVRDKLDRKLRRAQVLQESCQPYWKLDGWGELNLTIESARPLDDIRSRLAGKWESDTASSEFLLPDVGFLWVSE